MLYKHFQCKALIVEHLRLSEKSETENMMLSEVVVHKYSDSYVVVHISTYEKGPG